jgi:hypothetical protein
LDELVGGMSFGEASSVSENASGDKTRQKLRPWLISMIDSGKIRGLCWLDDEHTKFQIPWKHGGKQDWLPESGRIFMEWAKNTGKYREGIDKPSYACWKTRLRCAFNKSPDIVEVVKERHMSSAEPYRVYQFKPVQDCRRRRRRLLLKADVTEPSSSVDHKDFSQQSPTCDNTLPSVLAAYESSPVSVKEQISVDVADQPTVSVSDTTTFTGTSLLPVTSGSSVCLLIPSFSSPSEPLRVTTSVAIDQVVNNLRLSDSLLHLKIFYFGQIVTDVLSRGSLCHVKYGSGRTESADDIPSTVRNMIVSCELIQLPACSTPASGNLNAEKVARQLLETGLQHGVILWSINTGDIFAYRLFRCAVYHVSDLLTNGKPVKIPFRGHEPTKIFSYKDSFLPALNHYMINWRKKPDVAIHLLCGQSVALEDIDDKILIRATVTSQRALTDLSCADNLVRTLKQGSVAANSSDPVGGQGAVMQRIGEVNQQKHN